ncbi:rod shape-determining protein [Actinoplanes sp. KI2]|uniref:rod shape-determining protein n=1 Tax=Actinoplanes sp. KI2 TaxID=2983315 RepID=UPI0021D58E85|nr:rod shape-determining protein [Actinoplanes sp. KI2]MCU7730979.1 rod shape-determining protein [Actinoplanes sp. KI2]
MPPTLFSSAPLTGQPAGGAAGTAAPTAVALDLGSSSIGVWAARRGTRTASCGDTFAPAGSLIRRGCIIDEGGCVTMLSQLIRRFSEPIPAGGVVVACRPVLAGERDQAAMRRVIEAVFAPARLVFIDAVRAAAIGSGAAAGSLLVTDLGAQLTEVALLRHGRVIAARRSDIGTRDLARGATLELISDIIARHIDDLRGSTAMPDLTPALTRGLLLVGDGASHPELPTTLCAALRLPVHRAPSPRTSALTGAGLAATSLLRHPTRT